MSTAERLHAIMSFLPGLKTYLSGAGLVLTGLSVIVGSFTDQTWAEGMLVEGIFMVFNGFGLIGVKNAKTGPTVVQSSAPPNTPFEIPIDTPVIDRDVRNRS